MATRRQTKTYEFIEHFIDQYGHAPTMAEIAEGIGIKSRGVVHRYVQALIDEGLIKSLPNRHRNIQLVKATASKPTCLPLVGYIAAGRPIEAIMQHETIDIADAFLGDKCFALRVKGNSMIESGIYNGDVVVCEHSHVAENGQIVVALIDNQEATLKRFQRNPDHTITLIPANSKLTALVYGAERVTIQGIFVGLLRFASWK